MKFGMERSLKMKLVCTWGFDLKVDFDEVMEVTSRVLHPRDTRHPIPDFFGEIRVYTRYPIPEIL
jgi:hypothetical protein